MILAMESTLQVIAPLSLRRWNALVYSLDHLAVAFYSVPWLAGFMSKIYFLSWTYSGSSSSFVCFLMLDSWAVGCWLLVKFHTHHHQIRWQCFLFHPDSCLRLVCAFSNYLTLVFAQTFQHSHFFNLISWQFCLSWSLLMSSVFSR